MKIEDTDLILYNPHFTSSLLHYAVSGAVNNSIKYELIYYILPFVYNPISRTKLSKSNKKSHFLTLYDDLKTKNEFIDIENVVLNYREKTTEALIVFCNKVNVSFLENISINVWDTVHYRTEKNDYLKEYYKAAYNLGSIFSKEKYKELLLKF